MAEKALIIVDVQNDFCPGGALPVPDGDKIIPVINVRCDHLELMTSLLTPRPTAPDVISVLIHALKVLWFASIVRSFARSVLSQARSVSLLFTLLLSMA